MSEKDEILKPVRGLFGQVKDWMGWEKKPAKPSFQAEWDSHDPACAWRVSLGDFKCDCADLKTAVR